MNGAIITAEAGADDEVIRLDERNKEIIFRNCTPFTECISD